MVLGWYIIVWCGNGIVYNGRFGYSTWFGVIWYSMLWYSQCDMVQYVVVKEAVIWHSIGWCYMVSHG